jgi:fumarate reductase flavoprotein subunit
MNEEDIKTQIAIIGGGGAGLTAAVAAAEKGIDVIVLEKRHALGGNSAMAEGFLAAESPAQKRLRIEARKDDVFKIAMDYSHWRLNARIVRAFINKSGSTVQWLEDKGMYFDWVPSYFPGQRIRTWHCLRKRGMEIIDVLVRECEELGVRIMRETGAKKLLTDSEGVVKGVLAGTKEGEIRIAADCVIIATGGYGGNEDLIKKYYPDYNENMVHKGVPNKGDGLLMAMEVGAATEGLGMLHF